MVVVKRTMHVKEEEIIRDLQLLGSPPDCARVCDITDLESKLSIVPRTQLSNVVTILRLKIINMLAFIIIFVVLILI
jgi:uncharacterized membrane protein